MSEKLNQCIAALKIWVKMSEVKQKNQVKVGQNKVYHNPQVYIEELDSKFEDTLEHTEDGVEQV